MERPARTAASHAWLDGDLVPWAEARLHVSTACVLGGANVYEGIKGYWSEERRDVLLFGMAAHLRRLGRSLKMMRLPSPYPVEALEQAAIALVRANGFRCDVALRIVCYFGEGDPFGYPAERSTTGAFILAVPAPPRRQLRTGIHCGVSSWIRNADHATPPRIKAGANYQNVRYGYVQGVADGYDDVIFLNSAGKVCEAPLANLFLVRDGRPITPSATSGILEGVTRACLIELFSRELGLVVEERLVDRTELYVADEVFLAGTSREALPVVSVDRLPVGDGAPGPLTRQAQELLLEIARGRKPEYARWLTPVYGSGAPGAEPP